MFDHLESRDGDIPARRPFVANRRSGLRRRQIPEVQSALQRRAQFERRLDSDWRFSIIRQWMARILLAAIPG